MLKWHARDVFGNCDAKKKKKKLSGLRTQTVAVNLHLNASSVLIISNYRDNDVLLGGKIKFA